MFNVLSVYVNDIASSVSLLCSQFSMFPMMICLPAIFIFVYLLFSNSDIIRYLHPSTLVLSAGGPRVWMRAVHPRFFYTYIQKAVCARSSLAIKRLHVIEIGSEDWVLETASIHIH